MPVKHAKQSGLPADEGNPAHVEPIDWYADHTITGLAVGFIGAKAINTAATSMTNNTEITIPFAATDEYDSDGFHDPSSNNSRMTVPAGLGGNYHLEGQVRTGSFTYTDMYAYFIKNGTTILGMRRVGGSITGSIAWGASWEGALVAGDYVEFVALQASGGNRTLDATSGYNYFAIHKLDSGTVGTGIGARVYHSTTQALSSSGTLTALTFDSERNDLHGFHSGGAATRFTVPAGMGGRYTIGGTCEFAANATGNRALGIKLNGATYIVFQTIPAATGGTQETRLAVDTPYELIAGDYVELFAMQSSGGSLNVGGTGNYGAEFWITRDDSLAGSAPTLLLNHSYGSDDSGISIAGSGSFTDLSANETFTKARTGSVIRIHAKIGAQINDSSTGDDEYLIRLLIDSAGTPISVPVSMHLANATMNGDFFACGGGVSEVLFGLAAGSHTIKWQMGAAGAVTNSFYCRPSSASPHEFAKCQVIEEG